MPPPFFVWEFAFDWQEALLVPLPRRRGKPRRYKKANAPRTPIRNPRSAIRNSPPSPRRRGKPRRYKKANAFHAFLARVPIVPVLVPVPVHGVVLAKTSSSPWSGSIRALVYVNVYRFAVDVYGASRGRRISRSPIRNYPPPICSLALLAGFRGRRPRSPKGQRDRVRGRKSPIIWSLWYQRCAPVFRSGKAPRSEGGDRGAGGAGPAPGAGSRAATKRRMRRRAPIRVRDPQSAIPLRTPRRSFVFRQGANTNKPGAFFPCLRPTGIARIPANRLIFPPVITNDPSP